MRFGCRNFSEDNIVFSCSLFSIRYASDINCDGSDGGECEEVEEGVEGGGTC